MRLNTLKAKGWKKIKWCGPVALAMITGRTLKFCHNKLARLEGKEPRYLKGVRTNSMLAALREMGFRTKWVDTRPVCATSGLPAWHSKMTLRKYIEEVQTTDPFRGVMLVNVTEHFVVINKGMVADNHITVPVPVREHPAWRKKIDGGAWVVERK